MYETVMGYSIHSTSPSQRGVSATYEIMGKDCCLVC